MDIQKSNQENRQLVGKSNNPILSQRLQRTLMELALPEVEPGQSHMRAKMEILRINKILLPSGKANFPAVVRYPKIADLVTQIGEDKMLLMISEIVRLFCASMNVSRNMNADQIVEASAMLLDECGNFRLEDYVIMFQMAKRGDLKIDFYERIDIETVSRIVDAFWRLRHEAGNAIRDADTLNDMQGDFSRSAPALGVKYDRNDNVQRGDTSGMIGGLDAIREMLKPQDNG